MTSGTRALVGKHPHFTAHLPEYGRSSCRAVESPTLIHSLQQTCTVSGMNVPPITINPTYPRCDPAAATALFGGCRVCRYGLDLALRARINVGCTHTHTHKLLLTLWHCSILHTPTHAPYTINIPHIQCMIVSNIQSPSLALLDNIHRCSLLWQCEDSYHDNTQLRQRCRTTVLLYVTHYITLTNPNHCFVGLCFQLGQQHLGLHTYSY
jgi:hypothetical protein